MRLMGTLWFAMGNVTVSHGFSRDCHGNVTGYDSASRLHASTYAGGASERLFPVYCADRSRFAELCRILSA